MLKNHPPGLRVLFFTELWERFGFYIMMAVFTLHMDQDFMWDDAKKGNIYGLFLGAVFFTPVAGGWIADRWLGHRKTIRVGAVIMTLGYVMLTLATLDRLFLFYPALAFIAVGTGLFKANVSVLVGNLYESGSPLKDAGYNIFYMGINIGAFIAPLVATFVHDKLNSYNDSFSLAAVGMVLSMLIFERGKQGYLHADMGHSDARGTDAMPVQSAAARKEDLQRLASLGILFAIVIFFWMGFYQNGFALTLFAQRSTVIYSFLKPETYQSFGAFFILLLTPVVVWLFGRMRKEGKEPSNPVKIFVGMFVSGFSIIIMVVASWLGGDRDVNIMSPFWLISSYFVITIAEILVAPMGLSFVSKVAPGRVKGLMMGCWFGATAVGSYSAGLLGTFYSSLPHHTYFVILGALLFTSSLLVLLFLKPLRRFK